MYRSKPQFSPRPAAFQTHGPCAPLLCRDSRAAGVPGRSRAAEGGLGDEGYAGYRVGFQVEIHYFFSYFSTTIYAPGTVLMQQTWK